MILSNILFEVTKSSANNCYSVGERIVADDTRIIPPEGKGLCKLLIPRLLDIIEKEEFQNYHKDENEFTFSCNGDKKSCNGVLQLKVRDSHSGHKAYRKNKDKILKLISKIDFFKNFSAIELRSLFPVLTYEKSPPETIIIEKGSKPENAYIVLSGAVEVHDGEKAIASLGPGEIFGEMSFLGRKKAIATVKVIKTAWILSIKRDNFQKILTKYPKAQMFLVNVLSKRLSKAASAQIDDFDQTVMTGQLTHLQPAELLQMLNTSQKSGSLVLDLSKGEAEVLFWKGELIGATYSDLVNEEAFYKILKEKDGRFRFSPAEDSIDRKKDIIASFMGLLLEGLHRQDEEVAGC